MGRLDGAVVVVTGAGRGIGRAHATYLATQGATVVVNDTGGDIDGKSSSPSVADDVVNEILAAGGSAVADTHDVANAGSQIIEDAVGRYGKIDAVVNNAGIVAMGEIDVLSEEQFRRVLDVHVWGSVAVSRAAWPHMREQGYGRIVNTSSCSVFGVGAAPAYQTAKAAIIGLTKSLAADGAAHGIKVNAIMPMGYSRMADTQADLAEFMKTNFPPESISPVVGALILPETPVTGEVFAVSGGRFARVFLGTVPGLVGYDSIDDCLAGFDQAMNMEHYVAPTSMDEEIAFEYSQLGIDLSQLGIDLSQLGTADG